MRDLVALSALPAVWAGYRPLQVAEGLADAIRSTLRLDLVYLRLPGQTNGPEIEVACTADGSPPTDRTRGIGQALAPWLDGAVIDPAQNVPNPVGPGTVRLVVVPIGGGEQAGVLVAGSRQAAFPSEEDRLFLTVGANQAAAVLQRLHAEEALRESEERFRGTFENAAVGIVHVDLQGRYLRVNDRFCSIVGYDREELVAKTFRDITHPDDLDISLDYFLLLVRGELPSYSLEKRYLRKDGTVVWANVDSSLRRDAAGAPAYIISVLQDISGRKRLEEELNQAHARLELAVRGSNIILLELNMPDGVLENSRMEVISAGDQISGYDRSEVATDFAAMMALVHPDDRERVERALRAYLSGQTTESEAEYRVRQKDGSYRWRLARGVAVRDAEGRAIRFMMSAVDITELKRAEEALRASEQRFRTFVDHATDAFFLQAYDGVILDVNRQACESLGYTRDELIGMTPADFDPDFTPVMLEQMRQRGDAGEELALESRHRRKDGSVFPVEIRGRRIWVGGRRFIVSLARDITERKRLEAELRQARVRLDLAIRGSNVGLWEVDMPDGDYATGVTSWINVWEQLGLEPPADRSPSVVSVDFVHPDDKEGILRAVNAYLSGEAKEYEHEYRVRHKDGTYRWMLTRGTAIRDRAGKAIRLLGCRVDITELKRVQEALRESEAWFRFMANAMPQIVWTARPDGSPEYLNDRFVEYTGVPVAEVTGERWLSVLHPDDGERTMTRWMADVASGSDHDIEYRLRAVDGRFRWFKSRGLPVRDDSGQVVKWVGTITDIDDLKRAEEELRESERRLRTLTEALPHMVWTAEPDGAHDYFNARNTEYTGLAVDQLRGWDWQQTIHADDQPLCLELWSHSVATGELYEIEYRLRQFDGVYRWHLARALPLRDDTGRITKWFGSCIDIDDQKHAEEAMRRAKEVAEAANRAKDEFLAGVSHEIRTPMNAILGMTELALDTPLTAEQREYLAIVKSSADALLKVINDLLDFAKIEAGKLELDHADFSLRHVLGETLRALAFRAHKKGLELACRIDPEVPDALVGDAGRLRQVLLNLIGNAIKFTEQGEVVVRVGAGMEQTSTKPDPSVPGSRPSRVVHFSISDTGIGIPREKQEKIFQAFEQADSSTTRQYEGTGLGLSIASRLVTLMGGQITVESEPGRGSTFRFSAEFGVQPHPPSALHERPLVDLHGLRVLVVDDNATNRQILEEWLRGWHTEPLAVADGFKALDALWSAVSVGRPFALVLLDARMPGTDGMAVAESIRQNPMLSTSRIILLTSDDLRGDLARYRTLGIAAYAMKPVPQEELLEIIYEVLSRPDSAEVAVDRIVQFAAADSTAATPAPSARRLRILVAEDNRFNQQLVEHLLRRKAHDVWLAGDGHEALAALEQDHFDLMLLDVHMPGCDGFQVIEELRRRERATGGHLPVIALTARAMRSDRERCLQAGMDDYLAKPFGFAELFRVMERVLVDRPATEPEPLPSGRPEALLDAATLRAACDDDPTLLRKLIQVFRADTPDALARVREAVHERDAPRLREAAHRLRGLLSTFSTLAGAEAARLETMGASGQLDDAASTLDGLAELVGRLGPELEELSIEQLRHQAAGGGPV